MSGRGSSSTRGAAAPAAARGFGREARALQGWLMKPTARRRSLSSASSMSPTGVPSMQATASSPTGRGAQTTRSGARGRGLGRGRGTRARGRGRGRGGRSGRGSFPTMGETTPAVRGRGSRGRGRPRGRAGRASSREPVGARSQQESETVVKTEAGGSGQGADIRPTVGGEAAVPEDASSEEVSSSSSLEEFGTKAGEISSPEGSPAGRRVVGRISEESEGREEAAAAAVASDEVSSSGDDGMDVDDDDDDDEEEEEDDDDSEEDNDDEGDNEGEGVNDGEGDKESEEEEEEEDERSSAMIGWTSAQDDDSDEGKETDDAREKAAGGRDEAIEEGLDKKVLSAIINKIRQGREGDHLYKGLGKGWRKYCTAAKAAVRKKAEEPPRRPRRGRPPGSIGKKRKLLLQQQQEQHQEEHQRLQQQQQQPSFPSPRTVGGRKLLKLAAKPPSGGGGSGSPATVSSAARAARAARTWTKESRGGAGKQKRVPKAVSPRSRKKPAEEESHEEEDGAEDDVRKKVQGDGEGGSKEAETAAKPPGKKLSAGSKERVAYRPRRAGGTASKSTTAQGKFSPSSASRVTLASVVTAASAAAAPAAYASWTKKTGDTISRHPIVPGRTIPEDGRPTTTAAVVPAALPASSRDGGVGNGGSSSGGGGGGSSSIASSVGSSVSVVPDGRGKPTLRPSLVLARNPNRSGYQWPARVCDKDEVEESFSHSDLDPMTHEHKVLVVFLCEGGHHYFAWVPEGDVSLMPAGDIGLGKFGELWPVDFTAAVMWARQLSRVQIDEEQKKLFEAEGDLRRQEAPPYKKPRQASPRSTPAAPALPSQAGASTAGLPLPKGFSRDIKGKVGGEVAKEKGGAKRGGKWARKPGRQPSPTTNVRPGWKPVVEGERGSVRLRQGSVRCHPINAAAHSFFTDELECPWRCKDCGRFTRSCGCGKGLVEYVRRQGERSSHRFEKFACRNPSCICCKPPGLPLFMAEWALAPARFKLRDGERPPAEAKPRRVSAPPRWEREAISQGRASARGGSSDPDDTSPTDDATTAEGTTISGGPRSVVSINRANPQYFHRRLGANERCNKCEGCMRPNCGKCWACSHRIEFGGAGNKNQPCTERWCRTKAAQRHADKAERAARRKTLATGGGVSAKRTLDSSGEEYESDDGELSTVDGAGKRFRRSRRAGGGGSTAGASGGGGSGGRQSPVVGPGGDLNLSFVFIGDGHAGAGAGWGGNKGPQGCAEAVHVSTESAGVVTKVVNNTSTSQTARPSSISKNSRLKDLLTKGYRCLALLEEIGPQPLLKASARVIAVGSMLGSGFAIEVSGDEKMGKGIGLTWLGGELKLESAVRKRLAQFNPFQDVPEIETSTSIEPPPPAPLPEPDSQEAAQHVLRRQAQSQSNVDVYAEDSKNKLAASLPAAVTTAITVAGALGPPTSTAPALSTPSSAAADGGADNGGDVVGTMSSTRTPRPDALKEAGSGSSGDASGGASAAVTSATYPPDDAKGSSSDQAATHAKAVLGSGLAEASNVSKAEGVSGGMHGGAGKAEVDGGAVESSKGVGSETGGKACTVGQGAGGRGASGDVGAAAKAAKVDEAEEKERDAERGDGVVTSKYLGVTKQHGRWVARITRPLSGVESYLGAFDDDVQAAKQYDKYAKMWLENPDVNFPRGTANSRSRGVAPPPAPTSVSTISTTSSASTISSLPRSASCTTSAVSERSPTVVDSGVSEVAVNSLAKAAKKAIEGEDADIKGKKEQENQASPSPSDPPPSANEPATSKPRGDGDGDVNSSGGNKENPPPPPQIPLQSQHELEEQTKQKLEQAESEDDAEIAGSLLVEYLWGGKGEGKRPGEEDARGNVRGNGTGDGNSEVGTAACGGGVATMETATKTPTQGDGDSGEGSEVREGSGDDTAMMIDSLTSSDDSSATVATSDKGEDVDDEASGADEDGGGGADPEEAGVLLIPAVSRTLRRGYLAQSLARIVGAAGVIRKARRGVERRSGGEVKRENRRGGNDPGLQGAEEALALAKAGGTGEGDSVDSGGGGDGGGEASKLKGGTWGAAQEQSAAAMEALDALDRGIEELFDEDERTLRRYARAVEEDACRGLRKRLRQLENQEARAVVQLSKSRMEQEEQKADLAQLESIAGKAFSDNSIKALQDALAAERQAAAEYEARVAEEQRRLNAIKQDHKTTKASVAKEREAAAAAGQEGFMKDQEAFLKRVKEEWAALRSALRRRLGAARTLLLTDGACRLHAVPSDRLEQPRRMDEAWRALLFLEKVYPNETLLKRCVDPAWVEMVTPETILMLAHSRAYVDQLRTRVDEAGSSVECLTAIDASEDEAVATSTGGGGGGRRDAFQNTYGYGYGDRDISSRGNGARDKAERAMAVFGRDTVGNKRSWEAAMTAAGAVLEAVDRVLHGEAHNAFCAVRPPGHHAGVELHCMGAVSNGFCILNNVALAALYARHYGNVGRIAVVDFDVHHGNGTQDVLCRTEHPGFLYVSIHAFNRGGGDGSHPRIFPGTGAADEAHGNVLNIPLGDQVHPYAFHRATSRVIAALDAFRPNLILISAGFDAHQSDPSQLGTLSARDFEVFTRRLVTAAERLCGGRLVSVLEGGYALECQATVRRTGQARPPSPSTVGGVPARVGKKGRVASGETLADCIQAHCKGLVDGLIGGIDDD